MPRYTRIVEGLPATVPFVGPETQERARGRPFAARLGANESVFGPSPKAIAAMEAAARDIWKYGDPENFDLKAALAAHYGVPFECIVVGEGIDGMLGYLARLFVAPGDAVVTSDGAYPTFNYHVAGYGGVLHKVPYRDDHEDPDALIAKAVETGAKLIYLANPDNPMGTWHSAPRIQAMIEAVPDGCLLALDEAYIEFATEGTAPAFDIDDPRVIRFRTFSKAYGMAGARVGYAIGQKDLIKSFDKIRNHFGMNRAAQAGALAALDDQAYLSRIVSKVETARNAISEIGIKHGLVPVPSATNFVALDCGRHGDHARAILNELISKDVFVRMPFVAPQDRCIRISCGEDSDVRIFADALSHALTKVR